MSNALKGDRNTYVSTSQPAIDAARLAGAVSGAGAVVTGSASEVDDNVWACGASEDVSINGRVSLHHRLPWSQQTLSEVAELAGGKTIAFDVGGEPSLPIDEHRVQGMVHEPFVWKRLDAKHAAHALNVLLGAGQKMPDGAVCAPLFRVLGQNFGRVVNRIERDREQDEVFSQPLFESLLKSAEIIGEAEAEIRQRAVRVDEIQRDHRATQVGQRDSALQLIGQ